MPFVNPQVRKEKQREYSRKHRLLYPERRKESHRAWRKKNLPARADAQRKYREKFPTASQVRSRISRALSGQAKFLDTRNLLGCEWDAFCWFLESQFLPGMTWENYGEVWEIDHVTPVSWFDLSNPLDQKQAFHFSNHQPLWVRENRKKGNRHAVR